MKTMHRSETIAYLSSSSLISEQANSVHVIRMCDALAGLGYKVELHSLRGEGANDNDVRSYYGTKHEFVIHRHSVSSNPITYTLRSLRRFIPLGPICRLVEGLVYVRPHLVARVPNCVLCRNVEWAIVCCGIAKRLILEAHQPPSNPLNKWFIKRLLKHRNTVALVVISQALKREYLKLYPFMSSQNIVVAHDGADKVQPLHSHRQAGPVKIGYVGHLYPGRGVSLMLDLAKRIPEIELHIVGGRKQDIETVQQTTPPKNVYLHGHVPPARLQEYYSQFDIMLAPYQSVVAVAGGKGNTVRFMSPLKIFEYMSWGKAMIVSDLQVLKEILENDTTAIFARHDFLDDWVEKVRSLAANVEERERLGLNALHDFEANYTWSKRAARIAVLGA